MSLKSFLKKQKFIMNFVARVRHLRYVNRDLNLIKTLYINFKTQDFRTAIKFPIFIYGKVRIVKPVVGKIIIDAPIKKGMIRFGQNSDKFSASKNSAMFTLYGTLIFKGQALFSVDYALEVIGELVIGDLVFIGNSTRVRCWNKIDIGKGARITVDCQVYDTNFHYTRNIETGRVYRKNSPISIGEFSWIGNRTTIMKGTVIPNYSIVAGNSLCNKDYSKDNDLCAPLIAGQPAKVVGSGNVRVFGDEMVIDQFFMDNPHAQFYQGPIGIIDEIEHNRKVF